MGLDFSDIRMLDYAKIKEGQRWLYSTDLNIKHTGDKLKSTDRVDCEAYDIKHICDNGGIVLILAHKGRFEDGDAEELDFAVSYMSQRLGKQVKYFPENVSDAAVDFVKSLKPGDVAIMGNVRKNQGEEKNNPELAQKYVRLAGDGGAVAIGGFGKAHRKESSNAGVLDYLPGYLARSQVDEMRLLVPWAGKKNGVYSVAVLGGVKKEKIKTGLLGFYETYDYIIPGGIVLNTILKAKGFNIGDSVITDEGESFEKKVEPLLSRPDFGKVFVPSEVIIAKNTSGNFSDHNSFSDVHKINIRDGVPSGYMIVDYVISQEAISAMEWCASQKGRMIIAGTPGLSIAGFNEATGKVSEYLNRPGVLGVVLGGDTAAEIKFKGPSSTGGGSALHFVAYGTTEVFDALKKNKLKFSVL